MASCRCLLLVVTSAALLTAPAWSATVRVAACQTKPQIVDYHITTPDQVMTAVDRNLEAVQQIVARAGQQQVTVLVFPEDTLGLLHWEGMNEPLVPTVLKQAVARMLERCGAMAAAHRMYLVVCSDGVEPDGKIYNTAFLLGPDGNEIGRYHKVCPTWAEAGMRARGQSFPVFQTTDLGQVGMLICYDLVMPETARCLALQGAEIIFFPTMGGAAIGDDDIGQQALRVRAAENHVWLVVAHRGDGAMIISPRGKIVARATADNDLAVADIDPHQGRAGGDASNWQSDMRVRLVRERNPAAFAALIDPHPPLLGQMPIDVSSQQAGRIMARMLTVGEEEFRRAEQLVRDGQADAAISEYQRLQREYPGTWIDRRAGERLATLVPQLEAYFQPPRQWQDQLGSYRSPLVFDDGSPVAAADDWPRRRAEIYRAWMEIMGPWPPLIQQPRVELLAEQRRENFTQQRVRIELAPAVSGEGWLLIPDRPGPKPAVLVVYYEPETSVGLDPEHPDRDFALQLARRGFVTLAIGTPGGDARQPDTGTARCQPLSFHAYVAANCWHALANHHAVDSAKIGIVGHSYGGKWALFGAALWDKFAAVAVSDPGIVFDESRPNVNYWDPWYLGQTASGPPRPAGLPSNDNPATGAYRQLRDQGRDLHELHALIAPRPLLVSGGSEDPPDRWTALNHLVQVNRLLGFSQRVAMTNRPDHSPNATSNALLAAFFERYLTK